MRGSVWLVVLGLAGGMVTWPMATASSECVDTTEQRTGILKWAVLNVVFSASTAIATRTVDVHREGNQCVELSVRCDARAADASRLQVHVVPTGSSYYARFKDLVAFDDGIATCGSMRAFEGTDGTLRILFEG